METQKQSPTDLGTALTVFINHPYLPDRPLPRFCQCRVAKKAHKEGTALKEAYLALEYLKADDFDKLVKSETVLGLN